MNRKCWAPLCQTMILPETDLEGGRSMKNRVSTHFIRRQEGNHTHACTHMQTTGACTHTYTPTATSSLFWQEISFKMFLFMKI